MTVLLKRLLASCAFSFTVCLLPLQAHAQTDADDSFTLWAKETVQERMRQNNIPSVAIGVVRDGKALFTAGFGVKQLDQEAPVDGNSLFQIASQSKMLTGVVVNYLIDEGRLNLHEPIAKWLGDPLNGTARKELGELTLKHLLHHRSGLPNYTCSVYGNSKQDGRMYWTEGYSEAQLLTDLQAARLSFEPGSRFEYSNSGYALVGYLCEKASGMSYEKLLRKYVTRPYDLSATCTAPTSQQRESLATPYYPHARTTASKPSDWGMVTPSSGIFSSANDLTKLMVRQLQAYREANQQGADPLMLTRFEGSTNSDMTYGFGLFRNPKQGYANYLHGGNADGYSCAYVFSPEKNAGLVLLSSSGGHWFGQLEEEIYHKLTGEEYTYVPEQKSLAQAVFDTAAQEGIDAALSLFEQLKNSEQYYVRESEMNRVGYAMLDGGHLSDAIEIFKLNVKQFPNSWKALNSLGDAYSKIGEKDLAIQFYERSVQLHPQGDASSKALKQLKQERRTKPQETPSPQRDWSAEQSAIIGQAVRFSAAAVAEDTETQVSIYSQDAVIGPPGRPFISNTEGIRNYWTPREGRDMLSHSSKPMHIVVEGKLAYDWGTYEGSARSPTGEVTAFDGKYLIVWRKDSAGQWRIVHDMWN